MTITSMAKHPEWKKKPLQFIRRWEKATQNNRALLHDEDREKDREELAYNIFADMVKEFHREQGLKIKGQKL